MPLADVFQKLAKDQNRAPFAKPGEKQEACAKGYVLNKKGDCVKKEKKNKESALPKFEKLYGILLDSNALR